MVQVQLPHGTGFLIARGRPAKAYSLYTSCSRLRTNVWNIVLNNLSFSPHLLPFLIGEILQLTAASNDRRSLILRSTYILLTLNTFIGRARVKNVYMHLIH